MKERLSYSFGNKKIWLIADDPFYLKFWVKVTPLEQKRQLSIDIRSHRLSRNT